MSLNFVKENDMDFIDNLKRKYIPKSKFQKQLEELDRKQIQMLKNLSEEYKRPDNPLISIKSLYGIKKGDYIDLADGVRSHLIEITNECMSFVVVSKKGATIGKHRHDVDEEIKVLEGQLIEKVKDYLIEKGDTVTIKKLVPHNIEATEYSIYSVCMKLN